jgi:hypothetical protein
MAPSINIVDSWFNHANIPMLQAQLLMTEAAIASTESTLTTLNIAAVNLRRLLAPPPILSSSPAIVKPIIAAFSDNVIPPPSHKSPPLILCRVCGESIPEPCGHHDHNLKANIKNGTMSRRKICFTCKAPIKIKAKLAAAVAKQNAKNATVSSPPVSSSSPLEQSVTVTPTAPSPLAAPFMQPVAAPSSGSSSVSVVSPTTASPSTPSLTPSRHAYKLDASSRVIHHLRPRHTSHLLDVLHHQLLFVYSSTSRRSNRLA